MNSSGSCAAQAWRGREREGGRKGGATRDNGRGGGEDLDLVGEVEVHRGRRGKGERVRISCRCGRPGDVAFYSGAGQMTSV